MSKILDLSAIKTSQSYFLILISIFIAICFGIMLSIFSLTMNLLFYAAIILVFLTLIKFEHGIYIALLLSITGGFFGFDLPVIPPIFFVEIILAILLFVWFVSVMSGNNRKFISSPVNSPLFLFMGWSLISIFWAHYTKIVLIPHIWKVQFIGFVLLIFTFASYFIVVNHIENKKTAKRIVIFIILSSLVPLIIQYWDFFYRQKDLIKIGYNTRTKSFFGGNLFSAHYMLCLILSLSIVPLYKGVKKFLLIANVFFVAVGILITFARTSLVATLISLLFFCFLKNKKTLIILIVCLLLIFVIYPTLSSIIVDEYKLDQFTSGQGHWIRTTLARDAFEIIRKYPIFGIGFLPYGLCSSYWFSRFGSNYSFYGYLGSAHNDYLQVAVNLGIVGISLYFYFLIACWKETLSFYKKTRDKFSKAIAMAFLVIIVGFSVESLASESIFGCLDNAGFQLLSVRIYFWILLAVVVRLKNLEKKQILKERIVNNN